MDLELDAVAIRVLGALMEKSLATPDYYPMSLSALTAACNQKSSRDPVMDLSEAEVQQTLDALMREHLVRERSQAGARVTRFAHRLDDELGLRFGFQKPQLAVLALLMLRGPQTPGELRARSSRLHAFFEVEQVERVLEELARSERGPYVCRLGREPGRRESRYAQLFCGDVAEHDHADADVPAALDPGSGSRVTDTASSSLSDPGDLERRVRRLEEQVRRLGDEVARLGAQRD